MVGFVWKVYRFVLVADGRGRALRRTWFGGRNNETFGGNIPLPALDATGRDGTFDCLIAGCTNVAFTFSFDGANDSGVSPRLKLLFELPDDKLCEIIQFCWFNCNWKICWEKIKMFKIVHLLMKSVPNPYPNQFVLYCSRKSPMMAELGSICVVVQHLIAVALWPVILVLELWMSVTTARIENK